MPHLKLSGTSSRSTTFRSWAAPLLAVEVALLGLTACGSASSTSKVKSKSPVVEKKAGAFTKDVQLEVVNDRADGGSIDVSLCISQAAPEVQGDCPFNGSLDKGKSASLTSDTVGGSVHFEIRRYGGGTVEFRAVNPSVGEPYFALWENSVHIQVQKHELVEGEIVQAQVGGMPVQVERRGDTDVKVMRLIAK